MMSLGVGLILHPFSRIIEVGSPLGPMTCLTTGSWTDNVARYEFHLVEQDLYPVGKWLTKNSLTFIQSDFKCEQ